LTLGSEEGAHGDIGLAVRLRELRSSGTPFSQKLVADLDEAAWVIMRQHELMRWRSANTPLQKFIPSGNYGSIGYPAWRHGYYLARTARDILGIGLDRPILSMRELLEETLGVPLIQMELSPSLAGATIHTSGCRGIVANVVGHNQNVWARRATLAHE